MKTAVIEKNGVKKIGNQEIGYSLVGSAVEAKYIPSEDPMYCHNCFIEALPPALDPKKTASLVKRMPAYFEGERNLSPLKRLYAVQRIASCVVPLPDHIEIEQKISRTLHSGYFSRNPLPKEREKQIKSAFPDIDDVSNGYDIPPHIHPNASGFGILGASGVGKSTSVEGIINLTPQVIVHHDYNGSPLNRHQVVWMKLDCPPNGTTRGLCSNFFHAVDAILPQSRMVEKFDSSRRSADTLLPIMANAAGQMALGILFIDEIQRLKGAHKDAGDDTLKFLIALSTTMKIPVVFVGTYKSFALFQKEFAIARRVSGQGDMIMSNHKRDDVWDYFLNDIWKYQWTNVPTQISEALQKAFYEESQGILDIAIKLYMLVQWHLIGAENEKITPATVREVSKNNLQIVRPMLQALKTGDIDALGKVDDLLPQKKEMDSHFENACQRVSMSGVINTLKNQQAASLQSGFAIQEDPVVQIVFLLEQVGYSEEVAYRSARQACGRFGAEVDLKLATSDAFRIAGEEVAEKNIEEIASVLPPKPKRAKVVSLSGDLREIIKKAGKKTSPYDALRAAGVIKHADEFLGTKVI